MKATRLDGEHKMTRDEYIRSCLSDIISALDVPNLPQQIEVNGDFIFPRVALKRAKSLQNIDELFPNERGRKGRKPFAP